MQSTELQVQNLIAKIETYVWIYNLIWVKRAKSFASKIFCEAKKMWKEAFHLIGSSKLYVK